MKHPHRLALLDGRLWKCTIPGCNWFIYKGQEHILISRTVKCNECDETFEMDKDELGRATKDTTPKCTSCRFGDTFNTDIEAELITRLELRKAGVSTVAEMSPTARMLVEANTGYRLREHIKIEVEKDEVEIIEPMQDHKTSCPAYFDSTEECNCGFK